MAGENENPLILPNPSIVLAFNPLIPEILIFKMDKTYILFFRHELMLRISV